jgi:23S rRNA (guanosine2251-2'-O)-methyltransferase
MLKTANEDLNRLNTEQFKSAEKNAVLIVLDNVRSLNNIGSIFRTADAFLIEAIYLCGITATPPHREIHKTALGATETVAWQYINETITCVENLKEKGYTIIAIEQANQSIMLHQYQQLPHAKYAFVFGNEVEGVAQEVINQCHACIEIPQFGTKHSLNIAVSVGMVIWQFCKPKD